MRNCSGSMPPSSLIIEFRRKPVATSWSCVAFGQQVAGDLLDDELVVRHVAVERVDRPSRDTSTRTAACPFRSRRSRRSGPRRARCGPSARRSAARRAAARLRGDRRRRAVALAVRLEGGDLLERRRQADEVERQAAQQRVRRGRRRRARVLRAPGGPGRRRRSGLRTQRGVSFTLRHRRPLGRDERPVLLESAPWAIQRRSISICSGLSDLPESAGGIRRSGSSLVMRATSSLSSGFPATIIAAAPRMSPSSFHRSSRKSASRCSPSGPWHGKQLSARIGRTSRVKSISAAGASAQAAFAHARRADHRHDRQKIYASVPPGGHAGNLVPGRHIPGEVVPSIIAEIQGLRYESEWRDRRIFRQSAVNLSLAKARRRKRQIRTTKRLC